jgi:ORF6N domain
MPVKKQPSRPRRTSVVRPGSIERRIYFVRGKKVMIDNDLAVLYRVPTGTFNQAVRRNMQRFPADFMFQLTADEAENLRSQIVISSWGGPALSSLRLYRTGRRNALQRAQER